MSVATGTAIALGVGLTAAAAGGVASYEGEKGVANASKDASVTQAQEAQNALNFQEQEFSTQQANQEPFLKAGQTAVGDLSRLLAPGGSLSKQWTGQFQAPTAAEAEATPGYQETLKQGQDALQNSAAAQGNLLSGGTESALDQYSEGLASGTYQQSFNNALTQYQQSYNQFQQGQANQFNRLASVAGLGQTTAGQLGQEGSSAASNVGNIDLTAGAQQGQDAVNAASAMASGYNAIGNSANGLSNYAELASLNGLLAPQSSQYSTGINNPTPGVGANGLTPAV